MVYDHDRDDILSFEPTIWSTCDILRGAGIKQSDFPNFMMPFFALLMVESRIKRQVQKYIEEDQLDQSEILEQIQDDDFGYNTYLIEHNRSLKEICENDSAFLVDLERYLSAFDDETRKLLGVEATGGEKYMDIKGYIETLKAKKVLFEFCQAWSVIDLTPYSNSDITTLEEHRWMDSESSARTALSDSSSEKKSVTTG